MQNKWKTVRDGFTRHCRNLKKKSGSAASTAKKYTFYDQLLFLKDVTEDKGESSSNFDAPSQENPPPTLQSTRSPIEHVRKRQRKGQGNGDGEAEEALIEKLTKKINAETDSSESLDEDKSFLLSLLSDFKKISADWKLDAKLEILQVIKQYKTLSMPYSGYTSARPESQATNESLSSQDYVSNTLPSTSHSVNYTGYTALPARPESQDTTNESLSSQDSVANPISDLFSN